ncbi:hypothetical protein ACFWGN_20960 [Oerskovia sp. NPDC060338]|uniref:hypothetical protein n=1 Tax=Oerskovia sp. NPDC060338 TaxID=3347100 RepID=UPI00364A11A0
MTTRPSRVNDGKPRKPPTPAALLRMFMDLVNDHQVLMDALPAESVSVTYPARGTDPHYIARIVRSASIRKFVDLPTDQVYLTKIFEALDELLPPNPDIQLALLNARTTFERFQKSSWASFKYGSEPARNVHDVVDDLLYGRFAHSDYTKYLYSNVHRRFGTAEQSLMSWLHDSETLVLMTRLSIQEWTEDGTLTLDDSAPKAT